MPPYMTMRGWTSIGQQLLRLTLTVAERRLERARPAAPASPTPDPATATAPAAVPEEPATRPRAAQKLLRASYDSASRWLHDNPKPRIRQLLWQLAVQTVALTAAMMTAWIEQHLP